MMPGGLRTSCRSVAFSHLSTSSTSAKTTTFVICCSLALVSALGCGSSPFATANGPSLAFALPAEWPAILHSRMMTARRQQACRPRSRSSRQGSAARNEETPRIKAPLPSPSAAATLARRASGSRACGRRGTGAPRPCSKPMKSAGAISLFERPAAASSATRCSASVSPSGLGRRPTIRASSARALSAQGRAVVSSKIETAYCSRRPDPICARRTVPARPHPDNGTAGGSTTSIAHGMIFR